MASIKKIVIVHSGELVDKTKCGYQIRGGHAIPINSPCHALDNPKHEL